MSRADDLRALLARVEAAKAGGPDLDEAIHASLLPDDPWWRCIVEGRRLVAAGDPEAYVICPPTGPLGGENRMRAVSWAESARVGSYTTSVDAALLLIGKAMPGWSWAVAVSGGRFRASVTKPSPFRPMPVIAKGCATEGLVLIAALLSALIAQEVEHGR
ncbi:hypothetical protein [Methylobacterium aquaticum]|uniref:Uncharacterized protein n=1 Tax=Methylobacterium aquaticum TaxID=270351 RepID=A0A0C6FB18_9HYPH|nr:hypothetical protein [Methylobacterium aquaticum]BAQ44012.1 hypothetical protein Maq22A_c02770 [Methylobacterium aquaticum]